MITVAVVVLLGVLVVLFRLSGRVAQRASSGADLTPGVPGARRRGPGRLRGSRGAM